MIEAKDLNISRYSQISMASKQLNLKLPEKLFNTAEKYMKHNGFQNMQELIRESLREKVIDNSKFDESFTDKEIEYIDKIIAAAVKKGKFVSEEELNKVLLG